MDIQALKIEIVKQILDIESKDLLKRLLTTLKSEEKDFWLELTEEQKEEIVISRQQVKEGCTEDWESVYKRLK